MKTTLPESRFQSVLPLASMVLLLIVIWYVGAVWMNISFERDQAERANLNVSTSELIRATMQQERPVLPAPHQVLAELWKSVVQTNISSKRSLVYHAWVTFSATMLGFFLGTVFGIALAIAIISNRALDTSVMPWVIASQTIPILAIAPMLIVVLNAIGISGLLPKALISMYLSFFPIVVGMVKGLRSPDTLQFDLMRTYNATNWQVLWLLRWPAANPYLFASMKVAIAISLVGTIVGELPTGAVAGLGARLLSGSYYGQTVQIWAALMMAALLSALLVATVSLAEKVVLKRMGSRA